MFRLHARIDELEYDLTRKYDKLRAEFNCYKGDHEYELKEVNIPGTGTRNASSSACVTYDKRPVKVCTHCNKTINLEEVKEADNG